MIDRGKIKNGLKWFIVLVVIGSLIGFVLQTDLTAVIQSLRQVGVHFLWIILFTIFAQYFGAISWSYALPQENRISFTRFFIIRFVGENLGIINPANIVGGDSFKAYMLEKEGIPYKIGVSSLVISRVIMIVVQVSIFLIAALLYLFFARDQAPQLFRVIYLSILFLVFFAIVIILMSHLAKGKIALRINDRRWWRWMITRLANVRNSISSYYRTKPIRFYKSVFWSVVNFLVGSLEILLLFYFMGIEITYLEALLIDQGILFLKSFGAFIPGQLGVEEYSNKVMLGIVGITSLNIWISVSVLRRTRQVFWIAVAFIIYYLILAKKDRKSE